MCLQHAKCYERVCKINRMIVLTVKIPRITGRLESDSNSKCKAKETFPAKEKVNDGWVDVRWREASGKNLWRPPVACRRPQLKFRGPRNVRPAEETP